MKNVLRAAASLAAFALLLIPNLLDAQCFGRDGKLHHLDGSSCTNSIITAVPFLRIVSDARSGAMGDAGIAISADANAIHFNASKLAFAEKDIAFAASYTPWLQSLGLNNAHLAYLTGYKKLNDRQTVGIGLRYFSPNQLQIRNLNGQSLNTGSAHEFELAVAYARKLSDKFSAGLTGKIIYSNLVDGLPLSSGGITSDGMAGAADISFTYETPLTMQHWDSDLRIGLAFSNIGSKMTYTNSIDRDYLPTNLGLGVAWEVQFNDLNGLTITADVNKLMVPTPCPVDGDCDQNNNGRPDFKEYSPVAGIFKSFGDAPYGFYEEVRELMYAMGIEYWYDQRFAIRGGYFTENARKGARQFFTAGLGLQYDILGFNLSYLLPSFSHRTPLDNTLRFSMLLGLNNNKLGD